MKQRSFLFYQAIQHSGILPNTFPIIGNIKLPDLAAPSQAHGHSEGYGIVRESDCLTGELTGEDMELQRSAEGVR